MWTSVQPTQNIGFRIDDVSFCRDEGMNPKPQMQAGHVLEDDGRRRIMMLRDGLWFHDGQKVLAHNCLTVVATMNVA
jgi:peptide/nickel transport system substrate-binding protein